MAVRHHPLPETDAPDAGSGAARGILRGMQQTRQLFLQGSHKLPVDEIQHFNCSRWSASPPFATLVSIPPRLVPGRQLRRQALAGLVLEIEIPQRLPGGVLHDEARVVVRVFIISPCFAD